MSYSASICAISLLRVLPPPSHRRYKDERVSETFRGWEAVVLAQLRYYYRSPSRSRRTSGLRGSISGFYDQPIIEAIQVRWACVQTQLRVCQGVSVKLLLALRVTFFPTHLVNDTNLNHPPVYVFSHPVIY